MSEASAVDDAERAREMANPFDDVRDHVVTVSEEELGNDPAAREKQSGR